MNYKAMAWIMLPITNRVFCYPAVAPVFPRGRIPGRPTLSGRGNVAPLRRRYRALEIRVLLRAFAGNQP